MPNQQTDNKNVKKRCLISLIIILLFVYAYRIYKKRKQNSESDSDEGLLSGIRKSGKKKVSFKDANKSSSYECNDDEPNKNKINSLVQEILLKQIPC